MKINGQEVPPEGGKKADGRRIEEAQAPDSIKVTRSDGYGNTVEYTYRKEGSPPPGAYGEPGYGGYPPPYDYGYGPPPYPPPPGYRPESPRSTWAKFEVKKRKFTIIAKFIIGFAPLYFLVSHLPFRAGLFEYGVAAAIAFIFAIIPLPMLVHYWRWNRWEQRRRWYMRRHWWW